ncbi:double-strand break repair helicase AddA [Pseudohoeflea coraliihabitans]|uniref:DNA 3'-5' helicase n=1 Tax=Pseudohoeflea coraliihabitans TaxID=2860393 RepID=A0ABS6WUI7_9HYPH|nr:double-strand break repair helicase AddA [Pseudohoeflea sp. DP4N28-3]MBW3099102.1 double-strand break repair helicase AddA [Pseudohoeflea sp. DP4N28-3]
MTDKPRHAEEGASDPAVQLHSPTTFHDPIDETTRRQRQAADPGHSAWVSANAGSGKTHVLTNRVIRLLLAGARPSAILCLTYTKAAAAEMSNRVFRSLAAWTRLPDADLAEAITTLQGRPVTASELARARQLFAMALETPGGLKIQTIHAFCEAVLQRFPLEANIAGRFQVLDDSEARNLLAEARRALFRTGDADPGSDVAASIEAVLDLAGETGLEQLLREIYSNRRALETFFAASDDGPSVDQALRSVLGLSEGETRDDLDQLFWPLRDLDEPTLRRMEAAASGPKPAKLALDFAQSLLACCTISDPAERARKVCEAFFTTTGKPRAFGKVAAAAVKAELPDIEARLEAAQQEVRALIDRRSAFDVYEANVAALSIARRYIAEFERRKRRQGFLDFDDLVAATDALFARTGAGAWVHYKLDQGIDHILIDEAQDTAPLQWNVIRALAAEFFAGEGARNRGRTLFSVGDEKQSIYSFQGARPESFSEERRQTRRRAEAAGEAFTEIPLRVSFRSTQEVLRIVDLVYKNPEAQGGMGEDQAAIIHESARPRAPGSVELWDVIAAEPTPTSESWTAPFDQVPESAPAARLAARMADAIEDCLAHRQIADAKTGILRPARAGDVLVLVRKRDGFVPTLLRLLKTRGNIPVAGADRLRLTDHIAVQDLIAIGRYALLAADDLSLAALAKSPLIGLDEDALYRLAGERDTAETLDARLTRLAAEEAAFAAMRTTTQRWRELAQQLSVHDFYATLLGPDGGRARYFARLGSEVSDVLDEFLGLALDHDAAGIPGLQAFISMLDAETPEIKREMEQGADAVRVMTVHAAKGLEAPIVFLVDSGGAAWQPAHVPKLWLLSTEKPFADQIPVWLPNSAMRAIPAAEAAVAAQRRQAEEEYRRLLYVGLSRAADHLVVCGYRGLRQASSPTWHDFVQAGFENAEHDPGVQVETAERQSGTDTFAIRRLVVARSGSPAEPSAPLSSSVEDTSSAPFVIPTEPLPPPQRLPRPLVPSAAGARLAEDRRSSGSTASFSPAGMTTADRGGAHAAARGRAAHRLLQVLPDLPPDQRPGAAQRYISRALPFLAADARDAFCDELFAVLDHPDFAALFAPGGASEVSVMGTLTLGKSERVISGRIDRLAVDARRAIILDYKTGTRPFDGQPEPDHIIQLAIYRALLRPLYPQHAIEASLLYTAGPDLVRLDAEQMDAALSELGRRLGG